MDVIPPIPMPEFPTPDETREVWNDVFEVVFDKELLPMGIEK